MEIFGDVDLGPRYYRFTAKTRAPESHDTIPLTCGFFINFFIIKHGKHNFIQNANLKGTGTRDLIWLKVVSLDRPWLVGLTDDL